MELYLFTSDFCKACRELKTAIKKAGIKVVEYDVENGGSDMANHFGVRALPTLVMVRDGEVQILMSGYSEKRFKDVLRELKGG